MLYPLGREDRSIVYNCCWSSPAQSFSGLSPAGLMTIFYCLRFETPQHGGPSPCIYIPQEQGGPVIPSATGFPFHRLLRPAGLRRRYSTPPAYVIASEVLAGAITKGSVFWNITQRGSVKVHWCFGRKKYLHLQGRRARQTRNWQETGSRHSRGDVSPKRQLTFTGIHGVIFQTADLFISQLLSPKLV
jgi:hypothetical protein